MVAEDALLERALRDGERSPAREPLHAERLPGEVGLSVIATTRGDEAFDGGVDGGTMDRVGVFREPGESNDCSSAVSYISPPPRCGGDGGAMYCTAVPLRWTLAVFGDHFVSVRLALNAGFVTPFTFHTYTGGGGGTLGAHSGCARFFSFFFSNGLPVSTPCIVDWRINIARFSGVEACFSAFACARILRLLLSSRLCGSIHLQSSDNDTAPSPEASIIEKALIAALRQWLYHKSSSSTIFFKLTAYSCFVT